MLLKRRLLFATATATLLAVASYYALRDTSRRVAAKVDGCLLRGDVACVWSYVPEREKAEAGVDEAQFGKMLKEYYLPTIHMLPPSSPLSIGPATQIPDAYTATRTYRLSNGETALFSVTAAPTDDGIRVLGLLSSLPLDTMNARHPRLPSDRFTYDREIRALRADKDLLEKVGFKGFSGSDNTGAFSVTWEERIAQCEEKLAVLRGRGPEASN